MTTSPPISRREALRRSGAGVLAGLSPFPTLAQPNEKIESARLVIGSAPGGVLDAFARQLAVAIAPAYARSVFVENKTGASGQISISTVKASAADGATVLVTPMPMMGIYPHTYRQLAYNPRTDFIPVSMGAVFDLALAVGPLVPPGVKDLNDFFAWCKAHPDKASFGSPAAGSTPHFIGSMAARAAGVQLTHVPYRGPTPAISDMLGGQIPATCSPVGDFMPYLQDGKVRLLATTGTARNRFASQVPTFVEQGFKDIVLDDWFGVFLPSGTPAPHVQRLGAAMKKALTDPAFAQVMEIRGVEPRWSSPEALATRLEADTRRWGPIVKLLNFSADT
jgi:tripartite-type tricarboxylate transporter receptor subunit TctC